MTTLVRTMQALAGTVLAAKTSLAGIGTLIGRCSHETLHGWVMSFTQDKSKPTRVFSVRDESDSSRLSS